MPISGSDKALMQARSGIARAGATRSGYYSPNAVILINAVNRTAAIKEATISLALNDEADTAVLLIRPGAGFVPTEGQDVIIGLGTSVNREFAGQIARVRHRRRE